MTAPIKEYYEAYRAAAQAVLDAKEAIKVARKDGEKAAESARRETQGTVQEKLEAIRVAWQPYNERIAALQEEVARQQAIADTNFDAAYSVSCKPFELPVYNTNTNGNFKVYCEDCKPAGGQKGTLRTSDYDYFCAGCGESFVEIAMRKQTQEAVK